MKYILLLLLLALVVFAIGFRKGRPPERPPASPARPPAPPEPKGMIACARCGLHLPRDEALPGRGGQFCSAEHRAAFETERDGS